MQKNRNIWIMAVIALVNMLGYGIIIPILYGYSKRFGLSDFQNGLLFASFSICQFISTPIIGRLSDKYGRKPLLLISIIGTAISFILMAFANSAAVLFVARMLDGLTAGNIPVAFAVISDSTDQTERPKAFGMIGAALSFGFVFGPAISALTLKLSQAAPFLIAAAVTIVAIILTFVYLPETNKHMGEVKKGKLFDLPMLWHTLFEPNIGVTFLISLVFFLAFSCAIIYGFQPFTLNVLHMSSAQNAMLFTLFGAAGLITQTFLVSRISKWLGIKKAFQGSIFMVIVAFLLMFTANTLPLFIISMVILAVVNNVAQTLIPTILSQEADEKSQGSMMGLNASYQSVGMIVGPILGGVVATYAIKAPFLLGGLLMIICFALSFSVMKPGVHKESAF